MFLTKIFRIKIFPPNLRIIKNQITKVMCSSVWYSCKYDTKTISICYRNILVLKELGKLSLNKKENKNEYWNQIMPYHHNPNEKRT